MKNAHHIYIPLWLAAYPRIAFGYICVRVWLLRLYPFAIMTVGVALAVIVVLAIMGATWNVSGHSVLRFVALYGVGMLMLVLLIGTAMKGN